MKYNCKFCNWMIEGQTHLITDILKHEKTHDKERR